MKFLLMALAALMFLAIGARAQTTAFTYQGQLNSNSAPATGAYDFRFQIYNAGNSVVAGPLTNAPVGVTNGLFTVTLDFSAVVFNGSALTLEIGVRTNGSTGAYTVLSPRQALTSVPYAIQALNASNAVALTAPLQATNLTGTIPNTLLSTNVAVLTNNVIFSASVTATNFTGNGYNLSNLPAASLTGTIPDARLSANVALQSNTALNFAGNVSATNFTGGGHGLTNVPGAFFWVTVAGTNSQIYPNVGYIVTNNTAPVILTLPSSPSVGDVYKVAGVGAGGWIIAQNTNQMILSGNLSGSIGQSWNAGGSSAANWSAVASSADGTRLAAAINSGYIYTSTNSGTTWTNNGGSSGSLYWSAIASSADGTKLVASVGYTAHSASQLGAIYTSTNSGVTWTAHTSSPLSSGLAWASVASSADGTKLAGAVRSGPIYISVNSGTNWSAGTGSSGYLWTSIASSSDGTKLVAVEGNGSILTSTNYGSNWTVQATSSIVWTGVASSSDGTRLIATGSSGQIYTSANSGATWVAQNSPVTGSSTSVASSADGSRLATTSGGSTGNIFISSNFGSTWTQPAGAPTVSWADIASSADGSLLVAAVYGGNIYVSSQSSTTTGTAGYLAGPQHSAVELEYVGSGLFLPLSHEGSIRAY
ncbi:MAG: WD40/YVTN/BNR-like repeat-containing protein [Limisphaerales bacterium]